MYIYIYLFIKYIYIFRFSLCVYNFIYIVTSSPTERREIRNFYYPSCLN